MTRVRTPVLKKLVSTALRFSAASVLALGISALGVTAASAQAANAHPIPRGYDWLYNFHSGKCVYIVNGSDHNGAKLAQGTCENRREYGFLPKSQFSGSEYFFQDSVNLPSASHHFLCVSLANGQNGSTLIQEPCNFQNPPSKQRFVFHLGPFLHGYTWRVIDSVPYGGHCINIANASTANGAAVQQHQCATVRDHSSWFIFVKPGTRLPCPCTQTASAAVRRSDRA
jgi:hypothetical protein